MPLLVGKRLEHYPHLEIRAIEVAIRDPVPLDLVDGLLP
jgi:hypothetical protein